MTTNEIKLLGDAIMIMAGLVLLGLALWPRKKVGRCVECGDPTDWDYANDEYRKVCGGCEYEADQRANPARFYE